MMIDIFKKRVSRNLFIAFLLILVFGKTAEAQQTISLSFSVGFLGTQGNNSNSTTNNKTFATLGISKASFSQVDTNGDGKFGDGGTQGNDLAGTVKLYLTSGQVITLTGALNFRNNGGTRDIFGFIFDPGQNASFTYATNQTYNIVSGTTKNTSTSLGLRAYASTEVITSTFGGNASTSGLLDELNLELANTPQPSTIALTNASVTEGQNLVYTVTLTSATAANNPQVYTFSSSGTATGSSDYNTTYTFSNGVVNNGDGTITVPGGVSSFTITVATIDDATIESTETLILNIGSKSATGNILDNDAVPTLTTLGTLKTFSTCSGCTVSPQSFTVSGQYLTSNLTVTAPTGVQVSTNASTGFATSINIAPTSGTVTTTTVFAKLTNNAIAVASGVISVTSTGAAAKTITVTTNTDNALMFDGIDDYVNLGDVFDIATLQYTTEAWVYWKGSSNPFSEIFTKDLVQSFSITSDNKLHANFGNGTSWSSGLNSTALIPLNKWTHLAVTRSSSGVVKMYINGILDASTNTMNVTGNNTAIRGIGGKFVGTLDGPFAGAIDNLKVWNTEKTNADITNGMYLELAGNETNLLAYYDFNQGVIGGTNTAISSLLDISTSFRNGTFSGFSLIGSNSNFVSGFIPGIQSSINANGNNNALSFDGTNDYVLTNVNGTTLNEFTIETFINPSNTTQNTKGILQWANGSTTSGNPMVLMQQNGTQLSVYVNSGYNLTTTIAANTWSHIALVYANSVYTLYVNGVSVATYTGGISFQSNATEFYLGTGYNGHWNGMLDEVRVWNIARSATQINNNMYVDFSGTEAGLLAYYNMNQGTANGSNTNSLTDKTSNALNGTLTNFALVGTSSNYVPGNSQIGSSVTIMAGTTYQLANALIGGTWASSNTSLATVNSSTGVVTGIAAGSVSITYTICGKSVSYPVIVYTPTLTSTSLKTFTSCSGCTITPQSFTVSGSNLGANVIVTAPSGFEVSDASTGTYSNTLVLSPSLVSSSQVNVYARLINSSIIASAGNFTIASTGAASKTVTATVNTDNALRFDGTNDIVSTASSLSALNITGDITIETWVKLNQIPTDWLRLVGKGTLSNRTYGLWVANDGTVLWQIFGLTNINLQTTSSNILEVGKWYHIAATRSSNTLKIYINNVEVASLTSSGVANTNTEPLELGGTSTMAHSFLNGSLDEVRIWNVARTATQIQSTYLSELAGNESGLVANYSFNQGIGGGDNQTISSLIDRSTNAINGTITNFSKTGSTSNFVAGFIPDISGQSILNKGLTTTYTNGLTGGTWSSSSTNIATVNSSTGVVTGVNPGTSTITYTICEKTVSKIVTVVVPTITKTGTLTTFNTCLGTASASQTFTVSAQYLTSNLVLTAPTGYELSTAAGGTYSSTLSVAPSSGTVSARLIYVRLSASAVNGQSGNIAISSTDGVTQNVSTGNASVTRSVAASVSISSDASNNVICAGSNIVFTATPTNGGNSPTYQWILNGNNITGANSATYSTTSLATNDVITVVMSSSLASCITGTPATSNAITTTVTSVPATPGSISGQSVICMNSNQVYSIAAVPGATSYSWVVDGNLTATPSTTNVINITAANTANGSGTIKVLANNACGNSVYSSVFSITISTQPAPTASFTVSANTVCLTNGGIIFTNTSTPNATTNSPIGTYSWTFKDGTTAFTPSTSNTYTTAGTFDPILTITDGNQCTSSFTSRITIDPVSVSGTASVTNPTICEGSSTVLTLAGHTGTVQWEKSTDGTNFTNIVGANAASYNTGNLTTTTYYQAVVTSGVCSPATSGVITVTVSPTPAVTLASLASINSTATSFNLTYSNPVGNPDEYSITAVGPNAMPNFIAISNYGLPVSPITVSIPTSSPGIYNFNLVVKNGSLGCVSSAIPFTQTIGSASSTIIATGLTTYTYNGSAQGPATNTKTGSTGAVTYSYVGTGSTTYGPSATPPTNAGTYQVIATLAADANFSGATSAPYAFTITAAASTITVTGATTYSYNASPQGPATNTKTGSTGAVTYSYVGTGSTTYGPSATPPTNAGTYHVIATLAADANYSGATSAPYAFTISITSSTITVTGLTTFTYNGSAQGPATNTKTGSTGAVTYSYVGTGSTTYGPSATPPSNAGTYHVIATLAADATYTGATSVAYAFVINKLAPVISLADIVKTMGDPNFTISATSSSGGSITYSIANANIATVLSNTVTLTGVGITTISVSQAETENYLAATTTATLTVKPAAPSATPGSFIFGNPSNPSNTTGLISPNPGASLNFYNVVTGGTASSVQPLPTIVGIYTFYVSQTINGIEGPRVSYTVTILPSITVKSNTYIVGAINNPSTISSLVIGITNGSKPRWCNVAGLNCTDVAPALPSTPGVYIWCVKAVDIATGLESLGCVYDTVTILAPVSVMAVQKRASALILQPDGTYTMDFTFTLTNNLSFSLDSIQLIDNLSTVFTNPSTYKVVGVTVSGTLVASTSFNGSTVTNLLLPASKLGANKTETVVLKLQLLPQTYAGSLTNNVTAFALSPYGTFGSPASASFVVPAVTLFISDVITPNQDGKNDQWIIVKPANKQLKVEIVNRWGQRVFTNPDYQNNFVGRGTGSFLGQDLAEGTYFYFIEIVDRVTGVKEFRKGYLTLKR